MQNLEATANNSLDQTSPNAESQTPEQLAEELRRVSVFADLPDDQINWFILNSEERNLAPGEVLFRKGDPPDYMTVYLEGEIQARRDDSGLDGVIYIARAGDPASEVSGMLPFSRMTEFPSTSRAVTRTRLLMFPASLFPEMLQRMPVLAQRLVGVMSDRVREVTKEDQQRDKLIALGKLSAGLAHELNNPAAAGRRAAQSLRETLNKLRETDLRLCRHGLNPEQRACINDIERETIERRACTQAIGAMNAIERSDREDGVTTWLEEHDVADGWELSPTLVEAGLEINDFEQMSECIGTEALGDVLQRLAAQLSAARLVEDIETSIGRVSELVGAIKEYSYMDQAPVQDVDVRKAIDNTLLILKHKLKVKSIVVTRDYADDLPTINARGSELNQLWTNLIDNAIDAMSDGGHLRIRVVREGDDGLCIEIEDNGAGIPPDVQRRIFEPFFTTKPMGEGTGLGLDTVYRIVRKHHGDIRVQSKPGETCFQVRLPLRQPL